MPDDWTDGDRRRGGVKRTQAFSRNCRNQSFRCQGRSTSGENHEARVPMRSTGADCSVLATKRGNARRAKGAGHSRRDRWVNRKLEEPAGFDGRRQPLLSGTSRMTRECHVRLCVQERLACSVGRQAYRGNSQKPRSLDSRVAGNQDSEVYRQGLLRGDLRVTGP